jgi:phage-related protein
MSKPVMFLGTSLEDLRRFPDEARRDAGFQVDRVQQGLAPDDWKPLTRVGPGACEIRVKDESGIYRVIYVARFAEAVYVLHAFQKKTEQTSQRDVELARARYRDLIRSRSRK